MIMRLIDADEFKDYIIDSLEGYEILADEYRDFARSITRGFLKDIDAQPTAYDIDNVSDELMEKLIKYAIDNNEFGYEKGRVDAYIDAIKIVKRGDIK